jgi:16S rRNA processing protein RimM
MTNAPEDDFFRLGALTRLHGLDGTFKAVLDTDRPEHYLGVTKMWLKKVSGELEEMEVARFQMLQNRTALIRFKRMNTVNVARAYVGADVCLPVAMLPPLPEGGFYYHDVIGFELRDEVLGTVGTVLEVVEIPAHDLIVFVHGNQKRFLPVVDEFVLGADMNARVVNVRLPSGLLEL